MARILLLTGYARPVEKPCSIKHSLIWPLNENHIILVLEGVFKA